LEQLVIEFKDVIPIPLTLRIHGGVYSFDCTPPVRHGEVSPRIMNQGLRVGRSEAKDSWSPAASERNTSGMYPLQS
jgi:hypothetical protein